MSTSGHFDGNGNYIPSGITEDGFHERCRRPLNQNVPTTTNDPQAPYGFPGAYLTDLPGLPAKTDTEQAIANIAACRKALEGFHPHASPNLMYELTAAVDRWEHKVREENGLPQR
jgi:hypothetical protein